MEHLPRVKASPPAAVALAALVAIAGLFGGVLGIALVRLVGFGGALVIAFALVLVLVAGDR